MADAPSLAILPMQRWAAEVSGPIVIDGGNGYVFHQWGKPFEFDFNGEGVDENLVNW